MFVRTASRSMSSQYLPSTTEGWKSLVEESLTLKWSELTIPTYFKMFFFKVNMRVSPYITNFMKTTRESAVLVVLSPPAGSSPSKDGFQEMCLTLTKRTMSLRTHKGQVAFPGGKKDPGETLEEAACREAAEEVGLNRDDYSILGRLAPLSSGSSGAYVVPIVAIAHKPLHPIINSPDEVASLHYFHLSQLLLNSTATHHEYIQYRTWRNSGAALFPAFFAGTEQDKPCPLAKPSEGVLGLPEDYKLTPILPKDFPGEVVWGLTSFMTCELLARIAATLERRNPNVDEMSAANLLRPSGLIMRDPDYPEGYVERASITNN